MHYKDNVSKLQYLNIASLSKMLSLVQIQFQNLCNLILTDVHEEHYPVKY